MRGENIATGANPTNEINSGMVIPQQAPAFAPQQSLIPTIAASVELHSDDGKELLESQMKSGGWLSAANSAGQGLDGFFRYLVNSQALTEQRKVMGRAYEAKEYLADKEVEAVQKQEVTKRKAVDAQVAMLQDNNRTQKEITKLNQQRDIAIASIHERGRNERAKIYATSKAFSIEPAERNYGRPVV